MLDALVVGAGPAGALAAWRLARAGARVLIVDRATFPRDKLCGDTLNPGAVALLESLGFPGSPLSRARPLAGMRVTGPHARIEARYGGDVTGRAMRRRELDAWLVAQAVAAGARFEDGITVRDAIVAQTGAAVTVRGATLSARGGAARDIRTPALVTIGADGRTSTVARSVGLARHPLRPRRWAYGTYASGVADVVDLGEMHVRGRRYLGIAPIDDGLCNVCVVTGERATGVTPIDVVSSEIARDPWLRARFAGARFEAEVRVLGPLAVEADRCGLPGLLLAGDTAGFIDPMTGDGLHLAMRGGLLAAEAALTALEHGDLSQAVTDLDRARRAAFGAKVRFNRILRGLVESPAAVDVAGWGAHLVPGAVRWAVRHAGDAA